MLSRTTTELRHSTTLWVRDRKLVWSPHSNRLCCVSCIATPHLAQSTFVLVMQLTVVQLWPTSNVLAMPLVFKRSLLYTGVSPRGVPSVVCINSFHSWWVWKIPVWFSSSPFISSTTLGLSCRGSIMALSKSGVSVSVDGLFLRSVLTIRLLDSRNPLLCSIVMDHTLYIWQYWRLSYCRWVYLWPVSGPHQSTGSSSSPLGFMDHGNRFQGYCSSWVCRPLLVRSWFKYPLTDSIMFEFPSATGHSMCLVVSHISRDKFPTWRRLFLGRKSMGSKWLSTCTVRWFNVHATLLSEIHAQVFPEVKMGRFLSLRHEFLTTICFSYDNSGQQTSNP